MPNPPTAAVVVPVRNVSGRLKTLVRSLDSQDLPYARYRVVFVDLGSTDDTVDRLRVVARHRPQVDLLQADDRGAGWQDAAGHVDSDYVLLLDSADRLQTWGLRSLLEHAETEQADVVLGRGAGTAPIGFAPDTVHRPWRSDDPDRATAMLAPFALIRTELLRQVLDSPSVGWRTSRVQLLSLTDAVSVLVDPPVGVGSGPATGETAEEVWADAATAAAELEGVGRARFIAAHAAAALRDEEAEPKDADVLVDAVRHHVGTVAVTDLAPGQRAVTSALLGSDSAGAETLVTTAKEALDVWSRLSTRSRLLSSDWIDGRLRIALEVTLESGDPFLASEDAIRPTLVLRHGPSAASYQVPAEWTVQAQEPQPGVFAVETEIDPAVAAGGRPLDRGRWGLWVRLAGTGSRSPVMRRVRYRETGAAVVDGVPITPYDHDGKQFCLDVGAVKNGFLGTVAADRATIQESVAGSLLTIALPDVAVRGDTRLAGKLFQGSFALPATLVTDTTGARIECWASGLAGVSPLSAEFPPAVRQPLGFRLRIGETGDFSVELPTSPQHAS